jgi:hypothetical protein
MDTLRADIFDNQRRAAMPNRSMSNPDTWRQGSVVVWVDRARHSVAARFVPGARKKLGILRSPNHDNKWRPFFYDYSRGLYSVVGSGEWAALRQVRHMRRTYREELPELQTVRIASEATAVQVLHLASLEGDELKAAVARLQRNWAQTSALLGMPRDEHKRRAQRRIVKLVTVRVGGGAIETHVLVAESRKAMREIEERVRNIRSIDSALAFYEAKLAHLCTHMDSVLWRVLSELQGIWDILTLPNYLLTPEPHATRQCREITERLRRLSDLLPELKLHPYDRIYRHLREELTVIRNELALVSGKAKESPGWGIATENCGRALQGVVICLHRKRVEQLLEDTAEWPEDHADIRKEIEAVIASIQVQATPFQLQTEDITEDVIEYLGEALAKFDDRAAEPGEARKHWRAIRQELRSAAHCL